MIHRHIETIAELLHHPRAEVHIPANRVDPADTVVQVTTWQDEHNRSYLHVVASEAGIMWRLTPWTRHTEDAGHRCYSCGGDIMELLLHHAAADEVLLTDIHHIKSSGNCFP